MTDDDNIPVLDPDANSSPFKHEEIYVRKTFVKEDKDGKQNSIYQYTCVRDGTSIFMYPTMLPIPGLPAPIRMNVHLPANSIQEAYEVMPEIVRRAAEEVVKEFSHQIVIPGNPDEILKGPKQ